MKRNTKSALLLSVVSIIVCCTMLLGTTMAWFTDSVTSDVNKIIAGNLDVELTHKNKSVTTDTAVDGSTKLFTDVALWEPGAVVYETLTVSNAGTLALKYKLTLDVLEVTTVTVDDVTYDLTDVIKVGLTTNDVSGGRAQAVEAVGDEWLDLADFEINEQLDVKDKDLIDEIDETDTVTVVLYWEPSDNDNIFNLSNGKTASDSTNELKLNLGVTLVATQLEAEEDSFDETYDKNADYDGYISNAESLMNALENGGNYKLDADVTLEDVVTVADGATVTLDLNGNTLAGDIIANNADLTIVNGIILDETGANSAIEINAGTLYLENVDITSDRHPIRIDGNVTATINGGTYKVTGEEKMTTHALNVSGGATVTVNDGTFIGIKGTPNGAAMGGAAVNVQSGSTVVINGGNFSGGVNNTLSSNDGTLVVNGGTFDQDPTAYLGEGYVTNKNADGTWTVLPTSVEVDSVEELLTAVENGQVAVISEDANITLDESVTISNPVVGKATVVNNGTLTITGGTYENGDTTSSNSAVIENHGTLTISGGEFGTDGNSGRAVSNIGGTVTITGGTFSAFDRNVHTSRAAYVFTANGGTITIEDGTSIGAPNGVFYASNGGEIIVNGGTFTKGKAANNYYLAYANGGTITLNGGTYVFENSNECIWPFYDSIDGLKYNTTSQITLGEDCVVNWDRNK